MAGEMKLAPLVTELKINLDSFKQDMDNAAKVGVTEADKLSGRLTNAAKVGDKMSSLGGKLMKGLTVPIAGAGVASGKMAIDFESSFAKVSTLLDSNIVNFDKYKEDILTASNESKVAVGEFSEAVYGSISAGVDQTKAIDFTQQAMKLAKGGFTDGAKAVDVLTTAINGYNLESEESEKISDMLITTQNLGKTTVDELSQSMGNVIPVASSVNFGIDELSAAYAQLTKNGISTAESGTYLKSMLSELGKSGSVADKALHDLTGKGFAELKKEGKSTSDILNMLDGYAGESGKTLKDMFGSVEAGSAALVLAKGGGEEYNEMLDAMKGSAGATQQAFEKMDSTPAEQMKGALNKLKNEGIKLGASFVPVIEKVADMVGKAAEKFSSLTDEQKKNVVKWGAVLAGAGPVLKVLGGGISTVSKISKAFTGLSGGVKAVGAASKVTSQALKGATGAVSAATTAVGSAGGSIGLTGGLSGLLSVCGPLAAGVGAVAAGAYTLHENSKLMGKTILDATDDMSDMEKGLADLQGTGSKTKEELEKLGYIHKDFGDNISKEFQDAVEKSTKKVQDFNVELKGTSFDGVLTKEESDSLSKKVEEAVNGAITTISNKKEEVQTSLKEVFNYDGVISEDEKTMLEFYDKKYETSIKEEKRLKDEINAILKKASDERRDTTDEEKQQIAKDRKEISRIELEALAKNHDEIQFAKTDFANRIKTLDLKAASELVQEKMKIRDEEKIKVGTQYDMLIQMQEDNLKDMKGKDKEAGEATLRQLKEDKEKKLKEQDETYEGYLKIIEENNPKLLEEINKYNGKILTNEDKTKQNRLEKLRGTYEELDDITETGAYTVYNTVTGHNEDLFVKCDEDTGEIVGLYNMANGEIAGYSVEMGKSAEKMARDYDGSFTKIGEAVEGYRIEGGKLYDASGVYKGALEDVKEAADGTKTGIVHLNGTKVQIECDNEGAIKKMKTAKEEVKGLDGLKATIDIVANFVKSIFGGDDEKDKKKKDKGKGRFNGLDYVPYDGYNARLHKGERVLTAKENKQYMEMGQRELKVPSTLQATINIDGRAFATAMTPLIDANLGERAALAGRR